MNASTGLIRRFSRGQVIGHAFMLVCFVGLVVTGMPQKFPAEDWAKGVILIFGGVERVRFLHHLLGTLMALQLLWHLVELVWIHLVRRQPVTMLPRLDDARHFIQQVRFNLGLSSEPPAMDRYTFAEKIEYLALIWGTVLMVGTGLILLYPVRWTSILTGEQVLAAKSAHGGEAILAFLSIVTWHSYFVHFRHWNRSMWSGKLEEEAYAEEHPLELERIRRGEVPAPAPVAVWRAAIFAVVTLAVAAGAYALFSWMRDGVNLPTLLGRG